MQTFDQKGYLTTMFLCDVINKTGRFNQTNEVLEKLYSYTLAFNIIVDSLRQIYFAKNLVSLLV